MDNGATKKVYHGIFNEDPKIITKRLKRPKAPTLMYNLNKIYKDINLLSLMHINNLKNLSISN